MIPSAIERKAARDEHHRGERDQHGRPGEEHRLACRVHRDRDRVARREFRAEERAAKAMDDEECVVDSECEREHQREVHRPDRDLEPVAEQRQQSCRGQQAEDRQHQRQSSGDERPEGEREDHERHRPGVELGLQHRRAVRLVEVAPHARGAGQAHRNVSGRNRGQLRLQVVGGGHHRRRIASRAGDDDCRMAVGRDGGAAPRRLDGLNAAIGTKNCLHPVDDGSKGRRLRGEAGRVENDHRRRAGEAGEVLLDQRSRRDGLRAVCLPTGAREGCLDARREDREHDGDDAPGKRDESQVISRPPAEAAERTDPLLDRHRCLADFHYGHSTSPSLAVPTISYYYTNKSL